LSVLETDTLRSIENVQGSNWAETIKGNELSNNLHGGGGADRLEGGGQNDVLNGGLGLDTLIGGTGFDVFKFDTALGAGNVDSILDYNVADDQISLDDSVFRALANPGFDDSNLSTSAFAVGTAALDASDRIIYNSTSGALLYDSDGTGSAAAVQFATLIPQLNLTAADFVIV
jgi:Ca2+-binding RTX toxin-like protein